MTPSSAAADRDLWTRCFHPSPSAAVRLVCFPHAGGAAGFYLPLARVLGPGIEVIALQYPGRQDRRQEPAPESIAQLAADVAAALDGVREPFAFFGHSMGALVAYETARNLATLGRPGLIRLLASSRAAPSRGRAGDVHMRDDTGFVRELVSLGGTAPKLLADPELMALVLPTTRSDYKAVETYQHSPGPRLECPITALCGDDDPLVTLDEARAWSAHTTGEFDLRVYLGGHFYLEAHRDEVAAFIQTTFARI